jgi:hypothetical protein
VSRERISHSKLFSIQTCGEEYRRRYEENERTPSTLWMLRGSAVDSAANVMHGFQMKAKAELGPTREALVDVLPTVKDAAELAVAAFELRMKDEGVVVSKEDRWEAGSDDAAVGRTKDSVAVLGAGYVRKVAPLVNPIAVQRKIECKPKDAPFEIVGVIDLIEEGQDGEEVVVDTKVPGRPPRKDAAEKSEQLPLYAMLRAADVRKMPTRGILRHIVDKGKWAEVYPQEVAISTSDVRAMLARTETAYAAIKAGVFIPAQSGHWKCSMRFCSFFETCKYAIGRDRR